MRNGSTIGGVTTLSSPLGMDGGGFVSGIDIAADGTLVCRDDTTGSFVRLTTDTAWRLLFKPGLTYPNANQLYINPVQQCYEVCIAPSNSLILYAACMGQLWKTTDRGFNWTVLAGYNTTRTAAAKSNSPDLTMWVDTNSAYKPARLGGQHMRVSPTNPLNVGFVHPIEGLYYSTDGGTTWTLSTSVLTPTTPTGGNIYFVSDTDVWVTVNGRQPYHSTTGVNGTFTAVTGGPTVCASISGGGGNVYFCGDGLFADSQLYVWTGAAFATLTAATGSMVAVNPTTPSKVVVMTGGGDYWVSTNTGAAFTRTSVVAPRIANDVPWLAWTRGDYISIGATVYHRTLDRLYIAHGIGMYYLDNPPLAIGTNNLISNTLGIRNLLPVGLVVTPLGRALVTVEDRVLMTFTRANAKQQASVCAPDNTELVYTIRQGGGVDFASDDENYLVTTYATGTNVNANISTNGAVSWSPMPTIPTYTHTSGSTNVFVGGNIAVSTKPNMVWVSSNTQGGGVSLNGVKYSTDGGTTWTASVFGASVNMTGAFWHPNIYTHRNILAASKDTPGVFYVYCSGTDGSASVADLACRGMWKSINNGANFTRIKSTSLVSFGTDYWATKIKLVPGRAGHMFVTSGLIGSYPTTPSVLSVLFTPDDWATTYSLSGWGAPDDIGIGAKAWSGQLYQTLYVLGWRGGVYGNWRSTDFDPTNPTAVTWQLQEQWLMGRPDDSNLIAADPAVFGRVVVAISSGGGGVGDYADLATGT